MTFEEFFKKKRIDLAALQAGESSLFTEFETHFNAMGEKSFDHTKKYWFNKLRRQFPLAPEVKTEKVAIANPLAEQTITESLIDAGDTTQLPKVGFVPRFKAASTPKAIENAEPMPEHTPGAPAQSPKVGFTPRFKQGVTAKPNENVEYTPESKPEPLTEAPKVGFTPRFKAGVTTRPVENTASAPQVEPDNPVPAPKVGFTPRFKAGVTAKPAESVDPIAEVKPETPGETLPEEKPVENTGFKPAFKPRFNMKTMPPKPPEE